MMCISYIPANINIVSRPSRIALVKKHHEYERRRNSGISCLLVRRSVTCHFVGVNDTLNDRDVRFVWFVEAACVLWVVFVDRTLSCVIKEQQSPGGCVLPCIPVSGKSDMHGRQRTRSCYTLLSN